MLPDTAIHRTLKGSDRLENRNSRLPFWRRLIYFLLFIIFFFFFSFTLLWHVKLTPALYQARVSLSLSWEQGSGMWNTLWRNMTVSLRWMWKLICAQGNPPHELLRISSNLWPCDIYAIFSVLSSLLKEFNWGNDFFCSLRWKDRDVKYWAAVRCLVYLCISSMWEYLSTTRPVGLHSAD